MKKGTRVQIKKLAATENPDCQPADIDEYKTGTIQFVPTAKGLLAVEDLPNEGKSLPVEYTLQGELLEDIALGKPLKMLRTNRNGVEAVGLTETSPLEKLELTPEGATLSTKNSVYRLEILKENS